MTTERPYQDLPDNNLLESYAQLQESVRQIRDEMERRMQERDAIAIPDDNYTCEMPWRNTYDQERFTPLKELFTSAELANCLTPAWTETVVTKHPEVWNTSKVLALGRRYGNEAMRYIELARTVSRGSLTFKRKEKRGGADAST